MHRREYILASGAVLGASSIGAVAFTSASLDRTFSVNVKADNNAVIELTGGEGFAVNSDGFLNTNINEGLNQTATFTYGDESSPTDTYAFLLTNRSANGQDFEFSLTSGSTGDVTIKFYDNTDTLQASVSDGETDGSAATLTTDESFYAVVIFNTGNHSVPDTLERTLTINTL